MKFFQKNNLCVNDGVFWSPEFGKIISFAKNFFFDPLRSPSRSKMLKMQFCKIWHPKKPTSKFLIKIFWYNINL